MPDAVGPIVEIGRGESLGVTWRYLAYESEAGLCTQIETADGPGGTSCGGVPGSEPAGSALGLMSIGSATGSPTVIEGFAADEVEEVWIELQAGGRVAAALMPLAPAGMDGQVWLAYVPEGRLLEQVVAIGSDGEVLAEQPLDSP